MSPEIIAVLLFFVPTSASPNIDANLCTVILQLTQPFIG